MAKIHLLILRERVIELSGVDLALVAVGRRIHRGGLLAGREGDVGAMLVLADGHVTAGRNHQDCAQEGDTDNDQQARARALGVGCDLLFRGLLRGSVGGRELPRDRAGRGACG